ncbi:MAG TPA: manganese efflux pump MntP family protein [Spirochaetota bacterium]|nr:manganese efflux pump MntP family protein [Spirochaetota bacterium]
MDLLIVLGLGTSLAMDAFSISIVAGIIIEKITWRHYFRLSFHFGLFQFIMPIIGYQAGSLPGNTIRHYDHWIAFIILSGIGLKMIIDSYCKKYNTDRKDPTRGFTLVFFSIATSIDALAVGFSLSILGAPIFCPAVVIGVICSFFSILGIRIGKIAGSLFSKSAAFAGGCILIIIGCKILIDHI